MTIVMTKYKTDTKDYLVYDKNILSRDFDAHQWEIIANGKSGVGADYIIELNGADVKCCDKHGVMAAIDDECRAVIENHRNKGEDVQSMRGIEVRFTDSYINRLIGSTRNFKSKRVYIA